MFQPLQQRRTDDPPAWKALADPTRRAILDLLRERPRTTGDLANEFPVSRFGVMKHLQVLVEAGLVFVRRRGRERWNHLNPVPIQQIARRWIRPFEGESPQRLLRLKAIAERLPGETPMTQTKTERGFRTVDVQLEARIDAPRSRVWGALVEEIAAWWPKKFYVGTSPVAFRIEPRVGGRVYEDWGGGEGALWATVTTVRSGEVLQWVGDLPAEFGGPGRSITSFTLKSEDAATLVQFRDSLFGALAPEVEQHMAAGWKYLLDDCCKPWVEDGKQPERPESVR